MLGIKHKTTGSGTKVTNAVWSEDHVTSTSGAGIELIVKDVPVTVLSLYGQTANISWTDLDLTAATSPTAKVVLLDAYLETWTSSKQVILRVRKKGTDAMVPFIQIVDTVDHATIAIRTIILAMDANQTIQYDVARQAGANYDVVLAVAGYWE